MRTTKKFFPQPRAPATLTYSEIRARFALRFDNHFLTRARTPLTSQLAHVQSAIRMINEALK
jgi:hypothetical protein